MPTDDFTVTNNVRHQHLRRDRPGHRRPPAARSPPTSALPGPAAAAVQAHNAARGVVLDDGVAQLQLHRHHERHSAPWLGTRRLNPVRVGPRHRRRGLGDRVTFTSRCDPRLPQQPVEVPAAPQVTGRRHRVATFGNTRHGTAPRDVGGDLKLATFNVLNYFHTTGEEWVAARCPGARCTYFNDRAGNPIAVNTCTADPRRAASVRAAPPPTASLPSAGPRSSRRSTPSTPTSSPRGDRELRPARRADRDDAIAGLVAALNADAGSTRWAFAPSPGRGRPAAAGRAGRHPHGLHLQPRHGDPGRRRPRC